MSTYKVWYQGVTEVIEADSAQDSAEEFAEGGDWGNEGARLRIGTQELTECDCCAELAIIKIGDEHACLQHVSYCAGAEPAEAGQTCEWCDKPAIALIDGQEHACAEHLVDCAGAAEPEEGASEWCEVNVEADHSLLICDAVDRYADEICGYDPDDHDWITPVELVGGLNENPGVFSTGGTSMTFSLICSRCALRKTEYVTGSQHNPGECDTTTYTAPENDDIKRLRSIGEWTGAEEEEEEEEV